MRTFIVISTSFPAIHCWPDCPIPEVSFLKTPHRHVFHVKMKLEVSHTNRDIEFIQLKNKVDLYINSNFINKDLGSTSCEEIAEDLLNQFGADFVAVLEDNENGGEVYAN